jgi:intein-encoded DNA endonuclease-like protein
MRNNNAHIIISENLSAIVGAYNKCETIESIAQRYSIGCSTLRRYLSNLSLLRHVGKSSCRYAVNDYFFDDIDTEKKAYWLGVLYADGCVTHIRSTKYIVFSSVDKDWLEQYKQDIEYTGPILREYHSKYSKYIWKVKVTSEHMYQSLANKGVFERKSKSIVFPSFDIVPASLMNHFVRGYFDGDGSVGIYKNVSNKTWKRLHVSIVSGSVSFISDLRKYLLENDIKPLPKIAIRKRGTLGILTASLIAGLKLRSFLYDNATTFLKRKHDKFFECKEPKRTFNDYNRAS